jgi:hypothetical protein
MSNPFDFTEFENADLIPDGTIALLQMRVRYGDAADGVLTRSKNGQSELLKVEYIVVDGPQAKRKFLQDHILVGTTDGQKQMADKNKALFKAIIDSAKNLDPNDKSPEARKARTMQFRDFDGLRLLGKVGVEGPRTDKATGQTYSARNVLDKVITRGDPDWRGPIEQAPPDGGAAPSSGAPASPPAVATVTPISKPTWAQ